MRDNALFLWLKRGGGRSPQVRDQARSYLGALERCARTQSASGIGGSPQAPSRYVVLVSPERYRMIGGLRPALERNLAEQLRLSLEAEGYRLPPGPLEVSLREDVAQAGRQFHVQGFLRRRPAPTGFRLVLQDGDAAPVARDLPEDRFVVGRGPDCDILLTDEMVSHQHLALERMGPRVLVRDLDSRHGAYIGRERLTDTERLLEPGEIVQLGRSQLFWEEV